MVDLYAPVSSRRRSAHVIVLGNEKGGCGKSTLSVHLIVALLKQGHRVASIDTDSRQLSLTRYLENRARFARRTGVDLVAPTHFSVRLGEGTVLADIEAREFAGFAEIIDRLGERFDYVVVDTPASDTYRMRLSHALADTLVTPVNDSFVDLDVLGRVDGDDFTVSAISQYAEVAVKSRRQRRAARLPATEWVVVRNRIAALSSRNQNHVMAGLRSLSARLGFRIADGISERVVFRELFPSGLTVFDILENGATTGKPTMSQLAARREIAELVAALDLPVPIAAPSPVGGGRLPAPIAAAAR